MHRRKFLTCAALGTAYALSPSTIEPSSESERGPVSVELDVTSSTGKAVSILSQNGQLYFTIGEKRLPVLTGNLYGHRYTARSRIWGCLRLGDCLNGMQKMPNGDLQYQHLIGAVTIPCESQQQFVDGTETLIASTDTAKPGETFGLTVHDLPYKVDLSKEGAFIRWGYQFSTGKRTLPMEGTFSARLGYSPEGNTHLVFDHDHPITELSTEDIADVDESNDQLASSDTTPNTTDLARSAEKKVEEARRGLMSYIRKPFQKRKPANPLAATSAP